LNRLLLLVIVLIAACERPVVQEGELFEGVKLVPIEGHHLILRANADYELLPEQTSKIERINCLYFDAQTLSMPLDSIGTSAFSDTLLRIYERTLKQKMGIFGGMMKSYFEYFDKFQTLSLTSVERNGKTWQSLLKKHHEENHYWQSFYTVHKGNLIFITLFYALKETESPLPTTEYLKYLDAVRFHR
jgi:hypothetical protein